MIPFLIAIIMLAASIRGSIAAVTVALFIFAHDVFAYQMFGFDAPAYYGSAVVCCFVATMIIKKYRVTMLNLRLIDCLFAYAAINTAGLLAWYLYVEPVFYNVSILAANCYLIYVIMTQHDDGIRDDSLDSVMRVHVCTDSCLANKEQAKT